ncbi:MAG: L-rhamnose mutarotase [Thermomicrobiales bacterium]|nr:L-rhamnose mutarotase [Thermomicrobiales bacterium]MCO5222951.1 L-rhamnose mutarotase [Thermomicrobiales bacterium]
MRRAFRMRLKPNCEAIYKQKHDDVWPEVVAAHLREGITTFTIFREGLDLFAYLERDDSVPEPVEPPAILWDWWRMMEPYMECGDDSRPITWDLEEVFHMEASEGDASS